ncbi:MAG: hypothetical protein ACM3S0_17140 [Acidobacteriota bacterium]
MRRFYVKRKDLSHFPFQFYVDRNGVERQLEKGHTFTFAIEPPKDQLAFLHVHILQDFALELDRRWDIPQSNLIQVAARAFEAWVKSEPIPEDHFNNLDLLKVDAAWYPHGPDGVPALIANPYYFDISTDEPWFTIANVKTDSTPDDLAKRTDTVTNLSSNRPKKKFVFGFTVDVCPSLLFVGYDQFRNRITQAGLDIEVKLSRLTDLPPDVHTLLVPSELETAARQIARNTRVVALAEMVNAPIYDELVREYSHELA